jgi:hypothetical protein
MVAHGFAVDMLADLIGAGLATARIERVVAAAGRSMLSACGSRTPAGERSRDAPSHDHADLKHASTSRPSGERARRRTVTGFFETERFFPREIGASQRFEMKLTTFIYRKFAMKFGIFAVWRFCDK